MVIEAGDARGGAAVLRVGGKELGWEEAGSVFVFDDSFEHEVVWRDGEAESDDGGGRQDRIVLVLDLFHPQYSAWRSRREADAQTQTEL